MSEPLAGSGDIDWAGLDHAYGSAEDVPALLLALCSDDEEERHEALGALFTNIYHQGNRYGASAAAVPFLLAIASAPDAPERTWPLYLAVALAIGFDEAHLPSGIDIAGWRDAVARLRATGAELRFATAELAAYDAVRAGLPSVRGLLADPDAEVRAAAAYAVGWFPEEAPDSLAALGALLDTEEGPAVIANALVSAGLLHGRALLPCLREHLSGNDAGTRWAAAIALARLGEADALVVAELAACSVAPPEVPIGFLGGNVRLYSSLALAALDEPPRGAVDAVLQGLSQTSDDESFPMAEVALRMAFGSPVVPLPPFAGLTDVQQKSVRTIARLPSDSWRWGNLMEILSTWGVPTDHGECRRFAGLDRSGPRPGLR